MSQGRRRSPLPPNWQTEIRPFILARDPTCQLRIVCSGSSSTEVDHKGDHADHRTFMLQGVCHDCHKVKTGRDAAQVRLAKYSRKRPERPHPGQIITD